MQDLYLYRTTQTQKKYRHIPMPQEGYEPMIPVFKQMETLCALNQMATMINRDDLYFAYDTDLILLWKLEFYHQHRI
jgi:hypothetical protein